VAKDTAVHPELNVMATSHPAATTPTDVFRHGDRFYLKLIPPADGYLQVFREDGNSVQRMVPYQSGRHTALEVGKDVPLILFEPAASDAYGVNEAQVDEYEVTAEGGFSFHRLYVLFSPAPLPDPVQGLADEAFQRWLSNRRLRDARMSVTPIDIQIIAN
jgi:hypothetical protein